MAAAAAANWGHFACHRRQVLRVGVRATPTTVRKSARSALANACKINVGHVDILALDSAPLAVFVQWTGNNWRCRLGC